MTFSLGSRHEILNYCIQMSGLLSSEVSHFHHLCRVSAPGLESTCGKFKFEPDLDRHRTVVRAKIKPWGQENCGSRTGAQIWERPQNLCRRTTRTPPTVGCLTKLWNLIQGSQWETWPRAYCSLWLSSRGKCSSKSTITVTLLNLCSYVSDGPSC